MSNFRYFWLQKYIRKLNYNLSFNYFEIILTISSILIKKIRKISFHDHKIIRQLNKIQKIYK